MHSRIFLLGDNPSYDLDTIDFNEVEVAHEIGADYVTESENFEDDIEWLCNYLGEEISYEITDGIAIFKKADFEAGIQKAKKGIIEEIKKSLKEKPDDLEAIRDIVSRKGFYAFAPGYSLEGIEYFDPQYIDGENVYIYKTYDYHF